MSGYARFHRSLVGHPAFRNDAEAMAFAYMVLRASWRPTRVRYKARAIELRRGQLAMSVRDLAEAMDRDKGWVERLLTRLKSETMIETVAETGVLVITICNYDRFQHGNDTDETVRETADETQARQTQDTEQVREEKKKEVISEAKASSPALRPEHVVEAWNEMAGRCGLAKARMTEPRRRSLAARIRQHPIEDWTEAIDAVERNPWMHGANDKGWRADIDFLLQPKSFTRLIEGSYDRTAHAS
jgi:DNA-binding transcriptional regulator YhcF (GntR family)